MTNQPSAPYANHIMECEDDIEILFRRIEEHFKDEGEDATHLFSMFVEIALSYRDQLIAREEPALTVGETQKALDYFMVIVKTQKFPEISEQRIKELVIRWLEELPKYIHH